MSNDLRITLVQTHLHWEDRTANLTALSEKLVVLAGQTDLVILPEMFSTGFSMNAANLAEKMDGPTLQWMETRARQLEAVVTGSFITKKNGLYFNRLVWMQPDGHFYTYDKRHLFTLAGEQNHYAAGTERLIAQWKGWKICPLICYDLRFPVWSRNTDSYDLLLYVANWPERRRQAWQSLLTARAIENQSYTIGVNRIGNDGHGVYHAGDSLLVDFAGNVQFHCADRETLFTTSLAFEAQQAFRRKFAFLADRDSFAIH